MRAFLTSCAVSCLLSVSVLCAAQPLPRHILYLYDSRFGETATENDGDELYAMPLSFLGLPLEKLDVSGQTPPDAPYMKRFRGIIAPSITWSSSEKWCDWLVEQIKKGKRVFVTSSLSPRSGEGKDAVEPGELDDRVQNRVFASLGLNLVSSLTSDTSEDIVRVKDKAGGWFGFEAELVDEECRLYIKMDKVSKSLVSLLTLWWEDIPGSDSSVLTYNEHGGFAVEEYLIKEDWKKGMRFWRIDPIRYFEKVFGVEGLPRPEINMVNGGRTYFSHVDGDGFNNLSYFKRGQICAQVLYDEIYTKPGYGRLPVTLSVIGVEMDEGTTLCLDVSHAVARKLFALPQVEVACHAYSHPMDWVTKEPAWPGLEVNGKPYVFDLEQETIGALKIAESLAPSGKKAAIILWSGNCNPTEEAIALVDKAGYENMNGGDTRYDDERPSLTAIAPPAVQIGSRLRINTGEANDYIFQDEMKKLDGFVKVLKTFIRSAKPRLLLPVNVYYHFYAGERRVALDCLKRILSWTSAQDITPVRTSDYARMVKAAWKLRLFRLPGGGFHVEQDGMVPTLRFDDCTLYPDMNRCRGVIGYRHLNGALYCFLDGSVSQDVYLSQSAPRCLLLLHADRPIKRWSERDSMLSFDTWGPPEGRFRLGGLLPGSTYRAVFRSGKAGGDEVTFRSDKSGKGVFTIDLVGSGTVTVEATDFEQYAWTVLRRYFKRRGRFIALVLFLGCAGLWAVRRRSGIRNEGRRRAGSQ